MIANKCDFTQIKAVVKKEFVSAGSVNIDKLLDEGTEIAAWKATLGEKEIIKLFALFISDFVNSFNVSRPMNENQIIELAEDIAADLWFIKFEEIIAFFEAVKKGTIGKVYERLDAPMIWEFWDIYARKRLEVIEVRQQSKMFLDPAKEKTAEDRREGKIDKFGTIFKTIKENLQEK